MTLRTERIESLSEELFLLQILGDDRAIAQTYVAGMPMKRAQAPAAASRSQNSGLSAEEPPIYRRDLKVTPRFPHFPRG